ncbi:MAG: hypothetical protein WD342_13465 [Verrucomicrobiales bacterium]
MRDRYPISGIKQTYRKTSGKRTVVLPVAIGLVVIGMTVFFFMGEPNREVQPQPVTEVVGVVEVDVPEAVEVPEQATAAPEKEETFAEATVDEKADREEPTQEEDLLLADDAEIDDSQFTPWLSPLALDGYIRKKNEGFEQSFWERGHWITAVEGRWADGTHEFRIAYEPIPDTAEWRWHYRANQAQEEFAESIDEFSEDGYTLIHSQAFDRPDGTKRFQGVWRKELEPAGSVTSNRPEPGPARR